MGTAPFPLTLPLIGCWELEAPQYDSTIALSALATQLLVATEVYVEGSSISPEPKALFQLHQSTGRYLPQPQTLWTTGSLSQYRCTHSVRLLEDLSEMSKRQAEPELLDSLFLYRGPIVILEWPKAFFGPIWISKAISEVQVLALANKLQATLKSLPGKSD